MQFPSTSSLLLLAMSTIAQCGVISAEKNTAIAVGLKPLLTLTLPLVVETHLIPIPAGFTRTERYLNGTVTGLFKGQVYGGLAAPKIYPHGNGTLVTQTDVTLYGVTEDGDYWISHVLGISNNIDGYVGGQLYIAGKYANYSSDYLYGAISLNETTLVATAQIFLPFRK